uniref:Uncharacterized protein n=1 Tax=Setaria italica TaxID=4555 RepID=K3YBG6_SETIT
MIVTVSLFHAYIAPSKAPILYGTLATQQPAQQLFGSRSRMGGGGGGSSSSSTAVAAAQGWALRLRKQ